MMLLLMRPLFALLFLVIFLVPPVRPECGVFNRTIHFVHMFSNESLYETHDAAEAVRLAVETVNVSAPLMGYRLNHIVKNFVCQPRAGLRTFFDAVTNDCPTTIAFIGYGCPSVSRKIMELSPFWKVLHISYDKASTKDTSEGPDAYLNVFRMHPHDSGIVTVITAISVYYGWNKAHLIAQNEQVFTEMSTSLKETWRNNGMTLTETVLNDKNVSDVFPAESRIFILNTNHLLARRVLCYAVQSVNLYQQHVWITLGWYPENWWTQAVTPDQLYTDSYKACTDAALEKMLHWTLAVNHRPQPFNKTADTDVYHNAAEFQQLLMGKQNDDYFFQTSTAPFAYDAVFALAFALNNSINAGSLVNITGDLFSRLRTEMHSVKFTGVTGQVAFDKGGTRIQASLEVMHYRRHNGSTMCGNSTAEGKFERVKIGDVIDGKFQYISCESNQSVWGTKVPSDGSPITIYTKITMPLFVVYAILASLGIVFAIVCGLFNVIFRNTKIVRLTSPNLNYIIILGAVLMYVSVYLYCVSTDNLTIKLISANVRLWMQVIGFTLCFGTILAKVWRVYYIFHNPSPVKKKPPKDWHLFIFIMVLVAIDIASLVFVHIFDKYKPKKEVDKEYHPKRSEDNVLIVYVSVIAEGKYEKIWKTVIFVYKGLLQATSCVLAFRTRKVQIKVLNDAKVISSIIYITSCLLLLCIAGVFILSKYPNAFAAFYSTTILLIFTLVLSLLFVPKMLNLYMDPKGENIFEKSFPSSSIIKGSFIEIDREKALEKRVRDLELKLGRYETVDPPSGTLSSQNSRMQLEVLQSTDNVSKICVQNDSNDQQQLSKSLSDSFSDSKQAALEISNIEEKNPEFSDETVHVKKVSFSNSELYPGTIHGTGNTS